MKMDTQTIGVDSLGLARSTVAPVLWEAGHYYEAKGPTAWSLAGWKVMAELAHKDDARMLFVDDVHSGMDVHERERDLERIEFDPRPEPTHLAVESAMLSHAHAALGVLDRLPKRQRPRISSGALHCSGYPLISRNGRPLCLLYDLGLTWHKREMGFASVVNVVPEFYVSEQRGLIRLVEKAMPDLDLRVITHDIDGRWQYLE